jgi:negative regulator of sigma-B (phosphoserine phosphatase)
MKLSVSHASRAKAGEKVNGDAVIVRLTEVSGSLLAVVDALGHGPHAAEVAQKASAYLESVSMDLEMRQIVAGLHGELRHTRGAAAMVCTISNKHGILRLDGCGVGNVELRVTSSGVPVVLSPGILGGSVRQFRLFGGALQPGSRLVMFSDGISANFSFDLLRSLSPRDACQHLMSEHGRTHDDATVVIADCES